MASPSMEGDMGPSNREICFWFVTMLMTGIGMLKDYSGQPKMLVARNHYA